MTPSDDERGFDLKRNVTLGGESSARRSGSKDGCDGTIVLCRREPHEARNSGDSGTGEVRPGGLMGLCGRGRHSGDSSDSRHDARRTGWKSSDELNI